MLAVTPCDVRQRAHELLSRAVLQGTFLHIPIYDADVTTIARRCVSVPPSFRSCHAATDESTPREGPRQSKVHLVRNKNAQIGLDDGDAASSTHDGESHCMAVSRKQRREHGSQRPTRNQREHYRQLVVDLEAKVQMDPMHFDLSQVQLPEQMHPDSKIREFLYEKLMKRLGALRSGLLQCGGLQ